LLNKERFSIHALSVFQSNQILSDILCFYITDAAGETSASLEVKVLLAMKTLAFGISAHAL
jgi:hypothetical protein